MRNKNHKVSNSKFGLCASLIAHVFALDVTCDFINGNNWNLLKIIILIAEIAVNKIHTKII